MNGGNVYFFAAHSAIYAEKSQRASITKQKKHVNISGSLYFLPLRYSANSFTFYIKK